MVRAYEMLAFAKGRYRVRQAETPADLQAALDLRSAVFHRRHQTGDNVDNDGFDDFCTHVLIEHTDTDKLVCCFRMLHFESGAGVDRSYSAQFYDISALKRFPGPMLEVGRFCVDPAVNDPDVLRLAWGALARLVDDMGITLLFGCSSFDGTDPNPHVAAFSTLNERHLAPFQWRPKVKAPHVVRFCDISQRLVGDEHGTVGMPPLLRTYLLMGGWVSDHAVVDPHMNTLHVFTGVEIDKIPHGRKRLLRAIAAGAA